MPGKKPGQQEQTAVREQWRGRQFLISVIALMGLFVIWTMLTHSALLDHASSEKVGSKQTVSTESLNSSSPSKEYVYAGGRLVATEEPCLSDTQPPAFPNCPAINVAAAFQCPYAAGVGVNYSNPIATDNCSVMAVACNPPSGSNFSVGTTTVTCTATDISGNTATCSFAVNVFSACLVDDANPGNVVLFNASTGDYRFCRNRVVVATGRSTPILSGCDVTIDNVKGNRTVHISVNGVGSGSGTASVQKGTATICQISDSNLTGNACACP